MFAGLSLQAGPATQFTGSHTKEKRGPLVQKSLRMLRPHRALNQAQDCSGNAEFLCHCFGRTLVKPALPAQESN